MSRAAARVVEVRFDGRRDAGPVATIAPRISWTVETDERDWVQDAAEIELDTGEVHRIEGRTSVRVRWPFADLLPRARHRVRVRVRDRQGRWSEWSAPSSIVTAGHTGMPEWTASLIALPTTERVAQPARFRCEFAVAGSVSRATLYATARGVYQVQINGQVVDDAVLKPGWTSYRQRLLHETTDVTALVRAGENAIGIELAGGWYTESYGFGARHQRFYGEQPAAAAFVVIDLDDGTSTIVQTDPNWRGTGDGPLVDSGIYLGEHYDARIEHAGWSSPGFDETGWHTVSCTPLAPAPLPWVAEPVRRIELISATEVLTSARGATILDFGQNLVGRLRIEVRGERGSVIELRHAEVLEDGELSIRPLRRATAHDTYTLSGDGLEVWEPQFTFHGFRYAQIDGWPGAVDPDAITAVVLHSDMRRTAWFTCSEPAVERLHENALWSMRGNFLSIPTDCPQRDERMGWTGDIQVFAPTAATLFDCDAFLSSWLADLAIEQEKLGGRVPFITPNVLPIPLTAAAWGDAATVVPSVLFDRFGDADVLAAQYESMRAWSDHILTAAGEDGLWEGDFQFGDWLDPSAPPDAPGDTKTDADLIATAYVYRSASLVARAANRLGHHDDAAAYASRAHRSRDAFCAAYVTPGGRIVSDSPTAYALALEFDLETDPVRRRAMGDRLAHLVRAAGFHMATGFVGTPLILDALTSSGHIDAAANLLLQTENPSWLYAVTQGATTIWERWDSLLEDGSVNPGEMTSFNHYAFGSVADWLHRSLAGLRVDSAEAGTLTIAPVPLARMTWARSEQDTPYGRASAGWQREGDNIRVHAQIPPNTQARVCLPNGRGSRAAGPLVVGSGRHEWSVPAAVRTHSDRRLGLETSLATIAETPAAYRAVMDAFTLHDPTGARAFRRRTKWIPTVTLAQALARTPDAVKIAITESLAGV